MELQGAADGCFNDAIKLCHCSGDHLKLCKPSTESPSCDITGCFECNICLDNAMNPVVTLCGHLYCWPCIYKWLKVEGTSPQQCPVCKATLSEDTLVPLYGRGDGSNAKGSLQSLTIPVRPSPNRGYVPAFGARSSGIEDMYEGSLLSMPRRQVVQQQPARLFYPLVGGTLSGTVALLLPWVLRNNNHQEHSNNSNPRLRRQEMELERSMHQMWVFLLCCGLLCLLLF